MKSTLSLLVFLFIAYCSFSQDKGKIDYVILSDNSRYDIKIVDEDDDSIYFRYLNETKKKKHQVLKKSLKEWYRYDSLAIVLPLNAEKRVEYIGIIDIPDTKKDLLFGIMKVWFEDAYNSSKEVIKLEDKETGTLVGTGISKMVQKGLFGYKGIINMWHTVKIQIKDNKIRYTISEFKHGDLKIPIEDLYNENGQLKKEYKKFEYGKGIPDLVDGLVASMKESIAKYKKDNNW